MSGAGRPQKQGLGVPGSTAVGELQGSKPAAGISWGSLCRPIRRAAALEDKNRVRTYAQLLMLCYEPGAKNESIRDKGQLRNTAGVK